MKLHNRSTKTTKAAQKRLRGYSATKSTPIGNVGLQTFVVTHPDSLVTTHVTHHGQERAEFWAEFPTLANPDVWQDAGVTDG